MKSAMIALAWAAALAAPLASVTDVNAMPLPAGPSLEQGGRPVYPLVLTGGRDGARGADGVADDSGARRGSSRADDEDEYIEKPSIWNLWGWWPGRRGRDGHGPGAGMGGAGGESIAGGRGGDGGRGGSSD